jgi:hypothetical protein
MNGGRFPPPWSVDIFTYRNYCADADPMTLTNLPPGSGLFVLLALFLTVATIWLLLYAIETRIPEEIDPRTLLVLIIVIIPFVMVTYFGLAAIICGEVVGARSGRPTLPLEPSLRQIVPAIVTYIGLSAWIWLRWRKLRAKRDGSR